MVWMVPSGYVTVESSKRTALGPVGEAGCASEVELAGCVQDDAVHHDHGMHICAREEFLEGAGGQLDRDAPINNRSCTVRLDGRGAGVEHNNDLGSTES